MSGFSARHLDQPMSAVLRPTPSDFVGRATITICVNERPEDGISVSCGARGGLAVEKAIRAEISARGAAVDVRTIKCLGLCQKGPNVRLAPGNSWFHGVRDRDVPELVEMALNHLTASQSTG
ncbi:MAG TPA: (2Fe-2S) ferredoxin domain-containing protein [Alphaproteobacteria bacterium]|nr:(2Fe-2S) ferredoxin domain-containing protein [Alphaproteobacteria bacterium]